MKTGGPVKRTAFLEEAAVSSVIADAIAFCRSRKVVRAVTLANCGAAGSV
jgi:hypothetical protein